jgi:hypothetical protein
MGAARATSMPKQLIAFVDCLPEGAREGSAAPHPSASPLERCPALHAAQHGGFEHVILIADPRFRWDEILVGPDDRLLPDAVGDATPAPHADPPPETEAPPAEPSAGEVPAPEVAPDAAPEPAPPEPVAEQAAGEEAPPRAARREPKRAPSRTLGELRARLRHMSQGGRMDRSAVEQLGAELSRELGIPSVACRVNPPFARDREQVAFIRAVLGLLRPNVPAVLEFADGPRSTAALGLTLAHGIHALRTDVPIAELTTDRSRNLTVHPRSLLHAIEIQELWRNAAAGLPAPALFEHLRADARLQSLAAPYQRLARAVEFGSPAEAARAARSVKERIDLPASDKDDWAAAVRPAVNALADALASDRAWSLRQLWMAECSERRGAHYLTALHLREALVSGLLESYGHNPAKGWAPAGAGEHAEDRVRPRDVMAVVLADPESARLVPDLGQVWEWVGSPRTKFATTSPVALDPALLRDATRALGTLVPLTRAILEQGRLKAIVEALPFEQAIGLAVGQHSVRVAARKSRRGQRRGPHAAPGAPDAGEPGPIRDGATAEPAAPAPPPRRPREPRRGGEPARPMPARPREVAARRRHHDDDRRGAGPVDPSAPVTSIPIGGVIKVERASHGLGNLGLALRNAGLNPAPEGRKDKAAPGPQKPRVETPPPEAAAEAEAPAGAGPPPTPQPAPGEFDVAGPLPTPGA